MSSSGVVVFLFLAFVYAVRFPGTAADGCPSHKVRCLLSSSFSHCVPKMESREAILSNDCPQSRGIHSVEDFSGGSRQLLTSLSHDSCLPPIPPGVQRGGPLGLSSQWPGSGKLFPSSPGRQGSFPTRGASRESLAEMSDSQEGRLESHSFTSSL